MSRKKSRWLTLIGLGLIFFHTSACGPGNRTGSGWMTFRHDRTHSGYSEETLPVPLTLEWSYRSSLSPRPAWPEPGEEMARMQMDNAFQVHLLFLLI